MSKFNHNKYSKNNKHDKLDRASRELIKILRHEVIKYGFTLYNGFVKLDDIFDLKIPNLNNISKADIDFIVESNNKKRFDLEIINDLYYIKAANGHKKEVGDLMNFTIITEPSANCVHGTERIYIDSIKLNGLNSGERKHIHMVEQINENEQTSGYKINSNVLIHIDMAQCMADGMIFYRSTNGVILSEGFGTPGIIPSKYFLKIEHRI